MANNANPSSRYLPDAETVLENAKIGDDDVGNIGKLEALTKAIIRAFKNAEGDVIKFESGTTAERPSSPEAGRRYFDTDVGKPIWYDGSSWVDASGATV
jgi:hypothetical protein